MFKIIFFFLLLSFSSFCEVLPESEVNKIADAIFIIEGGNKTKYPYGIISIDTKGNKEYARRICKNTIRNNSLRFNKLAPENKKKYHCYLDFLADRYCSPEVDKRGNQNWKKNIHYFLKIPLDK